MDRYFYGEHKHMEVEGKDRFSAMKIFFLMVFIVLGVILLGYSAYSGRGFAWTFYPYRNSKSFVMCIEGEIKPTGQRIIVTDIPDDGLKTMNPVIEVNGQAIPYRGVVPPSGGEIRINNLEIGCNEIKVWSINKSGFNVAFIYDEQWSPVIKSLEIHKLKAGDPATFFIVTEDRNDQKIINSQIIIDDITRVIQKKQIYNKTINGTATTIMIADPGNYKATIRVFDNVTWSDFYQFDFTTNVITTSPKIYSTPTLTKGRPDRFINEHKYIIPKVIKPDDDPLVVFVKRTVNGLYIVYVQAMNYVDWKIFYLKNKYL